MKFQELEIQMIKVCKNCEYLLEDKECELYTDKTGCPKLNDVLRDCELYSFKLAGRRL